MPSGVQLAAGYIALTVEYKSIEEQLTKDIQGAQRQADAAGGRFSQAFQRASDSLKRMGSQMSSIGDASRKAVAEVESNTRRMATSVNDAMSSAGKQGSKSFGQEILESIRAGAKDAGVDLEQELVDAMGRAGAKVGEKLHDVIAGAVKDSPLSGLQDHVDGVVDVVGRGRDAVQGINDAVISMGGGGINPDTLDVTGMLSNVSGGLSSATDALRGMGINDLGGALRGLPGAARGLPGRLRNMKPGDIAGALKGKDITGALTGASNALNAVGLNDAGGVLGDAATKADQVTKSFQASRDAIAGTTSQLSALAGNSGKIGGGLSAITAAAGPLGIALAGLKMTPGFMDNLNKTMAFIQGTGDFDANAIAHTFVPGLGWVDRGLKAMGFKGNKPNGPATMPQNPQDLQRLQNMMLPPGLAGGGTAGVDGNGRLFGPGTGISDSILGIGMDGMPTALVSTGEGVVKDRAMKAGAAKYVAAFNAGWLPKFDDGTGAGGVPAPDPMMQRWIAAIQSGRIGADGSLPMGVGGEGGLQTNTIRGKRLLSALFPEVTDIGGYRQDALKWHPSGLALDVMTPGGSTRGGRNESGRIVGDQIKAFMAANSAALGSDYTLWRTDEGGDHYNHDHVNFAPSGMPGKNQQYFLPAGMQAMLGQALQGGAGAKGSAATLGLAGAPEDSPMRSQGYIPAGAGGTGQAGSSFASGLYMMAGSAINNVIDQAVSAAASGASLGVNAIAPGAGGAAGGAASAAMGIGANMAKMGVNYGFQMAGIWTDSLAEILMPFGVPRLFQTDPTQFMPQLPGQAAGVTTGEKAAEGMDAGGPVQPAQLPGAQPIGPPVQAASPGGPGALASAIPQGKDPWMSVFGHKENWVTAGVKPKQPAIVGSTPPPGMPSMSAPPPAPVTATPKSILDNLGIPGLYDDGGWLMPGQLAISRTSKPEPVFNTEQFANIQAIANRPVAEPNPEAMGGSPTYDYRTILENVSTRDADELARRIEDRRRIQMMRYAGRP